MSFTDTDVCLRRYSDVINTNPILSREDELALFNIVKKFKSGNQKQDAREKIIKSNLRLVIKEANYYSKNSNVPIEDLIGAGSEGLCIAIDKFNPRKYKTKLSTYAVPWIRLKILKLITSFESAVYIPSHIREQSRKYRKMLGSNESTMTDEDLQIELKVNERGLQKIRMAQNPVASLSAILHNASGSHAEIVLGDVIGDPNGVSPRKEIEKEEIRHRVAEELAKLDPKSLDILTRRYLGNEKENLSDIGSDFGLTSERIRQIEYKALKLLRRRMKNRNFFGA